MKRIFRLLSLTLAAVVCASCFSGCDGGADNTKDAGRVYYLNFKPEQDANWQKLAKAYTGETGVDVTVVTAAEGNYEKTLTSEMDKSDAPTMFQVNGPVGLKNWKSYCLDLSDSQVYSQLTGDEFALKEDGKVYGVAYVIETYGLIYNKTLLNKYFKSDWSTVKSADELNNFDALKATAEEIQKHKDEMGVKGAFASAGMDSTSDWRFKTHLANVPLYYEYRDRGVTSTDAVEGRYLDGYKAIWDLYINNSTADKTQLSGKTSTDAQTEFKTREAVFYQNGTWEYSALKKEGTEGLEDDEMGMLPIYIGVKGEENQGLCTGSENYWCVNSRASDNDVKATLDFMNWCVTSDEGTRVLAEDMGFAVPFKDAEETDNPLNRAADEYAAQGKESVSWNFTSMPGEDWKNGVGAALTQYASGSGSWDDVVKAYVDGWKTEYAKANG